MCIQSLSQVWICTYFSAKKCAKFASLAGIGKSSHWRVQLSIMPGNCPQGRGRYGLLFFSINHGSAVMDAALLTFNLSRRSPGLLDRRHLQGEKYREPGFCTALSCILSLGFAGFYLAF